MPDGVEEFAQLLDVRRYVLCVVVYGRSDYLATPAASIHCCMQAGLHYPF